MSLEAAEMLFDKQARVLANVFHTPAGREALQFLQDAFDPEVITGATVEDTYFKLGQRDVVKYIETLLRRLENKD